MSDEDVLAVLQAINNRGLTMRNFLLAITSSKHPEIKKRFRLFAHYEGVECITKAWHDDNRTKSHVESAATSVLATCVKRELKALAKRDDLRLPSTAMSRDRAGINVEHLLRAFEISAPRLSAFTKEVANNKKVIRITVQSILLFAPHRRSDRFQQAIGLYLYSAGTSRRATDLLNQPYAAK